VFYKSNKFMDRLRCVCLGDSNGNVVLCDDDTVDRNAEF